MKKINKKIITSFFVFFIILLLSISIILANDVTSNENYEIDTEKIYYEIKYFDSKIVNITNLLNDNNINWKKIEEETCSLYNYWNSVILDLNYLDINKKDLTNFGKNLDELTLSIKYNNEKNAFSNLIQLYEKLIIYTKEINYNNYENILLTKYNLLISCSIVETENWTLTHEYILKASENIFKLVNTVRIKEYEQYNINQAYVAVKEMENVINVKNNKIFSIKYKIALDKLENL